jgi:hypothetical protein
MVKRRAIGRHLFAVIYIFGIFTCEQVYITKESFIQEMLKEQHILRHTVRRRQTGELKTDSFEDIPGNEMLATKKMASPMPLKSIIGK